MELARETLVKYSYLIQRGLGWLYLTGDNREISSFKMQAHIGTNNSAEYLALVYGLFCAHLAGRISKIPGLKKIEVFGDSQLVINQMIGKYQVKTKSLFEFYIPGKELSKGFEKIKMNYIPRENNSSADILANLGLSKHYVMDNYQTNYDLFWPKSSNSLSKPGEDDNTPPISLQEQEMINNDNSDLK